MRGFCAYNLKASRLGFLRNLSPQNTPHRLMKYHEPYLLKKGGKNLEKVDSGRHQGALREIDNCTAQHDSFSVNKRVQFTRKSEANASTGVRPSTDDEKCYLLLPVICPHARLLQKLHQGRESDENYSVSTPTMRPTNREHRFYCI